MKRLAMLSSLILASRILRVTEGDEGGAGASNVIADISKFNQGIDDAEEGQGTDKTEDTEEAEKPGTEEEPADKTDTDKDKEKDKSGEKKEGESDTEEKTEESEEGDPGEAAAFEFTADADFEKFQEERKAYLETVDISPELQTILDRQDKEIEAARSTSAQIEGLGKVESIVKMASAVSELFDAEIVDGKAVPKTEPLIAFMRENFKHEFTPLAVDILAGPSVKYRGATMFEQVLMDEYGAKPEQLVAVTKFLETGVDLPVPPPGVRLPSSVDESLKEAWYKVPELKRFEVEGLTKEIADLEKELKDPDTSSYDKDAIKERLGEKREKLAIEVDSIKDKQSSINSIKAAEERREQQDRAAVQEFVGKVITEYNTNLFTLSETAAKDLAPRLTYIDADQQIGEARDKLARVANALSFRYDDEGNIEEDPVAEHYAKQLTEEGIAYDFNKARNLLKDQFKATWKLQFLRETGGSPGAIDKAETKLRSINADIKTEQKEILGLIAEKRVTSTNKALEKKVKSAQAKKQAVAPKIGGQPAIARRGPDSTKKINEDIAAYNRQISEEEPDLEDIVFDRKSAGRGA